MAEVARFFRARQVGFKDPLNIVLGYVNNDESSNQKNLLEQEGAGAHAAGAGMKP